jgi:molybdopterin converting factor subunit 1
VKVTVRYFASARERTGCGREELELPEPLTVSGLWPLLVARHPALAPLSGRLRLAVNQEFAQDDQVIPEGAEVALIPPVAGG